MDKTAALRRLLAHALLLIPLLAPNALMAQDGSVEGRVVETKTALPLAEITVELTGTEYRTVTGPDGRFVLSGIPAGRYELAVLAPGVEDIRELQVEAGETLQFLVRLSPTEGNVDYILDPITVTAGRVPERLSTVPASVSVVEAEEIAVRLPQSVDDVVRGLPNVTTFGGPRPQAELPQIRGLGASRVLFFQDGVRQNFSSGHKGRLFLDPALLEQTEVVRGPGSALYGNGALGGVFSFRTKDGVDLVEPGQTLGIRLAPRYVGGNDEIGGSGAIYGRPGPVDFLAAGSYWNAQDARLGTGTELPFSAYEAWSILGNVGWTPDDQQRIEVSYNRFDEASTTPLNANQPDTLANEIADRRSKRETLRLSYQIDHATSNWLSLRFNAYRNGTGVEEERLSDGRFETRDLVTWGLDVANTSRFDVASKLMTAVTYGVEYFADDATGRRDGDPLASFPDGDARFVGLYVQNPWVIAERLTFRPGLRWESYESSSVDPEQATNQADELALKFALQLEATDFLSLWGSYAEGFNAPRLLDLYISGLHFPAPPGAPIPPNFFIPNPDLVPERTDNVEGGIRLGFDNLFASADGLRFEFSVFGTDAKDFISRDVDVRGGTTTFQNLDRVDINGFETSLRYESDLPFVSVSYGQVRMQDAIEDEPVFDAPADTWLADLGVRLAGRQVTLGYRGLFAAAQERVTDPELATPAYTVHDFYARWMPGGSMSGFDFTLRVDNIFDEEYRRHGSFIPEVGRSVSIQIAWQGGLL